MYKFQYHVKNATQKWIKAQRKKLSKIILEDFRCSRKKLKYKKNFQSIRVLSN